jgi:hypothetical protein
MNVVLLVAFLSAVGDDWDAACPAPDSTVTFRQTAATLQNRGTLVSKKPFPNGAIVTTTWRWTKGPIETKYPDMLVFAFFTTGKQRPWAHEITDGAVVRFGPPDTIYIQRSTPGEFETLAKGEMKMVMGTDYKIAIEATPAEIRVLVDDKLIASAPLKETFTGQKVAIYNREGVGGVLKESLLLNLIVLPPAQ